jgi:predicted nucleic acid-binding protein
MNDKEFWDSNLWIYLFTKSEHPEDVRKKQKLEVMLRAHPQIVSSVQVLNEVANALIRKYAYPEDEVREFLKQILLLTENQPMTSDFSFRSLELKQRYQLGWYDSLIVAVALESGCRILYSEDMQDGLVLEGTLTILNPFKI